MWVSSPLLPTSLLICMTSLEEKTLDFVLEEGAVQGQTASVGDTVESVEGSRWVVLSEAAPRQPSGTPSVTSFPASSHCCRGLLCCAGFRCGQAGQGLLCVAQVQSYLKRAFI